MGALDSSLWQKGDFYGSWIYFSVVDLWLAFPFVLLLFQNHEANSNWELANPIVSSATWQSRMQQSCSLLCAQILYLHKPIRICVSIFYRCIYKFCIDKPCSPASLLDRLSCTLVLIPRNLPAGSTRLMQCYPIISTIFHDYYQLKLRTEINGCITEGFRAADENKVLF